MLLSNYFSYRKTIITMAGIALSIGIWSSPIWAQSSKPDQSGKSEKSDKDAVEKKDAAEKRGGVAKIEWSKLAEAKELDPQASIEKMDDQLVLKVVRDTSKPQLIPLVTVKEPKIKEKAYILRGKVRMEGVVGDGYLEMWNHFPEPKPGAYFSRTMAETGPMGKFRGTAPWREFTLPFMINDNSFPAPNKLQINVYLPEKGTVWLSDLTLDEMPLDKLQKELGSAFVLPGWFWGVLSTSIFLPLLVAVGLVMFFRKFRTQEHGTELRRMKALDLG